LQHNLLIISLDIILAISKKEDVYLNYVQKTSIASWCYLTYSGNVGKMLQSGFPMV